MKRKCMSNLIMLQIHVQQRCSTLCLRHRGMCIGCGGWRRA